VFGFGIAFLWWLTFVIRHSFAASAGWVRTDTRLELAFALFLFLGKYDSVVANNERVCANGNACSQMQADAKAAVAAVLSPSR
jgi:hypothetical protein